MKALIIVDMLVDFVDGKLANPRARRIIEPLQRLLEHARENDWVVVFSNDAHRPGDPELEVWGEHAMEGDPGAQVIAELAPRESDTEFVSPKRVYGAFDMTGLHERLDAIPHHEWQIVIVGVLFVLDQCFRQGPALCRRQTLQRGSQVEPDHRRRVRLRHRHHAAVQTRRQLSIFQRQLNYP